MTLSVTRFRIGVALLARKIAALTRPGETVGLMLPNANGTAVAFMAVQSAGRVAAMLNFTAGAFNVIAACKMTQVRTVLSSRAFVEKGKLEALVKALEPDVRFVWLEDLRDSATNADKIAAWFNQGKPLAQPRPDDPAVVLFTSGSEGAPKGVVLSHKNLLANCAQVAARFDFTPADIMFSPLPVFHAFGLMAGMILGLTTGMKIYLYPTPLHYRQIPELVYGVNATALLGADTFLAGYAKMANPYDFRSLRYVVCGAEPVKPETRRVYMEKFGLRIFEGYGVTETSPVLAVNTPMFNRNGTVGRMMPGMEHRLEPVPGIDDGGRLHVRGPNVMAGYYRIDSPGELEPPPGGWHDTGDIVDIDAEGFLTILGRAKRFAKIGGEIVSLAAIEQLTSGLWPDHPPAVVAAPDARKGERVIMGDDAARRDARRGAGLVEDQRRFRTDGAGAGVRARRNPAAGLRQDGLCQARGGVAREGGVIVDVPRNRPHPSPLPQAGEGALPFSRLRDRGKQPPRFPGVARSAGMRVARLTPPRTSSTSRAASAPLSGSRRRRLCLRRASRSRRNWPPCSSTSELAIDRPRPEPFMPLAIVVCACTNGRPMRAMSSSAMPGPSSST